jgi:predicted NAD/FAD-dependent oxidoreductase
LSWQDDHWQVQTQIGEIFQSDRLILTPPVPQSLTLLDNSGIALTPDIRQKLEKVAYYPCITMLALLEKPSQIPAPGGLWGSGNPLGWIASNDQKGISARGYAVTLQAGPEFSQDYWDKENEAIAQELLKAAAPWIGSTVLDYQIHRWRYSQVSVSYGEPCLKITEPGPLVFAGDGFLAPKIEGAVLSGLAAARSLFPLC